jgi:hypothetical protein
MAFEKGLLTTINHFVSVKTSGANGGTTSLATAFEDGVVLAQFTEAVSGEPQPIQHEKPKFKIQKKQNITMVLDRLTKAGCNHSCDAELMSSGNAEQNSKLAWNVLLKYHLRSADEGLYFYSLIASLLPHQHSFM